MNNRQISTLVKKFVKQFGEIHIARDDSFAYFYSEDKITYTTDFTTEAPKIESFKAYLFQTFGLEFQSEKEFFIFSLLHEIGHAMTMDSMSNKELTLDLILRKAIHLQKDEEKANKAYYNLPSEKLANEWANEYYTENYFTIMSYFEDLEI